MSLDCWLAALPRLKLNRRDFALAAGAAVFAAVLPGPVLSQGDRKMYGLIGKMSAVAGQRDALIAILLDGVADMPGCRSYVVAMDPAEADAIWITEVWTDQQSHRASLKLPAVREAISRGKPLLASFGTSTVTEPVGGHGLVLASGQSFEQSSGTE